MQDLKQINFVTNLSYEELRDTPTILMFATKKIAFKFLFLFMIQIKRKPFINKGQAGEQFRLSKTLFLQGLGSVSFPLDRLFSVSVDNGFTSFFNFIIRMVKVQLQMTVYITNQMQDSWDAINSLFVLPTLITTFFRIN